MKRWPPRILPHSPLGWLFAILLVGMAVGSVGDCLDWTDRRACRVDGGEVQKLDDFGHEWRCVRGGR